MAQLTSQCTNTIYRWQFKRCGSPQQDKGQAVPGGCSLPGCSRGLGRGVSAALGCGWEEGCVRPTPKMYACLRKSGQRPETDVIEVKCKQLAGKGCIRPGLPPPRAWRGEKGGDRAQHLPLPFICKPWQEQSNFLSKGPQRQKWWGNCRRTHESAALGTRRFAEAGPPSGSVCAPPQITLALMSSEESTRHIGPLDFKTGLNWNHIAGILLS